MNCPSCGSQQIDGTAACTQCGAPLPVLQQQAFPPQQGYPPQQPQQPGYDPNAYGGQQPGYDPNAYGGQQPGYDPNAYGGQQPGYPPQGYAPPGYGAGPYGYPPPEGYGGAPSRTSGMAIAGFVLSFFCALLGIIFSSIALNEINKSGGTVGGKGLAIAGLVISIVGIFLNLIILAGS